jgi:plasmid stabilization system protein ParE
VATLRPLNLRFGTRARLQLLQIERYLNERNPDAAARVGASIRDAAELLRFFPDAGRPGQSRGTREWVVRALPYLLVYQINADQNEIMVLGVFHAAQDR